MFLLLFLHVIVNINFSKLYKNVSYYEWNVQSQNNYYLFMLDFEKYFIIIYFIIVFILYLKI